MPGWFCKNGSAGQLDPFADQATVDQRDIFTPQIKHNNLTAHIYGSEFICWFLLLLLSPSLLGRYHTVVWLLRNCSYYSTLKMFEMKHWNISWMQTVQYNLEHKSENIWKYCFFVVHTALRSFKEEEDHCVLCACQNNLKCQLLLVFTQLKGSDNTVGFPDTIFSSISHFGWYFITLLKCKLLFQPLNS